MRIVLCLLSFALPTVVAAADPQALIDAAIAAGQPTVTLPAGVVRLDATLRITNAEGLTIEGPDTTLLFTDPLINGVRIDSSRNLTLRGFTIDYDPLPFVQATITGRSDDGKRLDFTVHEGYPGLDAAHARFYRQAYVFEADAPRWKPWVPDLYPRSVEIHDARHGTAVFGGAPAMHERIAVGDRLVFTIRASTTMRFNNCENVRVEDLTFHAGPGGALLGRYMRGEGYFRYVIEPGPPPAGATEPRLLSTCADGFNYAFASQGPTLEGCRFSFMGDDSVNLHGVTLAVLRQPSPTELLVAWPYTREWLASVIPAGATARRLRPDNYEVLARAPIAAFEPLAERSAEDQAVIQAVWPRNEPDRGTVFRLTLAEPMQADPGDFIDVPESNSPGFVIRDCEFTDHRARGLRIMASDGLIERNTFRRLKMNAITLGAEYGFWREAGWVENITVRDNLIEEIGYDAGMRAGRTSVLGAISVFVGVDRDRTEPLPPYWPGNRNIVIENNTIRDCPMAGIFVFAAQGVRVVGNRLAAVLTDPGPEAGTSVGLDLKEPIDLRYATEVVVEGNVIE